MGQIIYYNEDVKYFMKIQLQKLKVINLVSNFLPQILCFFN